MITDDRDKATEQRESKFTEWRAHHSRVPGVFQALLFGLLAGFLNTKGEREGESKKNTYEIEL